MDDVAFGYVYDFGGGEEWVAERGAGARLNDAPLAGDPPKDRIELLALDSDEPQVSRRQAGAEGDPFCVATGGAVDSRHCCGASRLQGINIASDRPAVDEEEAYVALGCIDQVGDTGSPASRPLGCRTAGSGGEGRRVFQVRSTRPPAT